MTESKKTKVIAFILPQFHAIPENDEWWGRGFTEWTNVRKATPQFNGHNQPRVPQNDNYYNLLDPAVHDWQAELARQHHVHGLCYYHYWFNGRMLLERPLQIVLDRGKPDLPFCMAWANEPWTRAWDGGERHVLMPQTYGSIEDWRRHFDYLLRAFKDPRYIKVDGKPVFLIYRTASISGRELMFQEWRRLARLHGFPDLHLVAMKTGYPPDPLTELFDAYAEFEPMYTIHTYRKPFWYRKRERWVAKMSRWSWRYFGRGKHAPNSQDYAGIWKMIVDRALPPKTYPGAFVDWDNSARRDLQRALVFRNVKRETFRSAFGAQYRKACDAGAEFLFVNAWNEWAEGTYLEPDTRNGTFYLESIKAAVESMDARGTMG